MLNFEGTWTILGTKSIRKYVFYVRGTGNKPTYFKGTKGQVLSQAPRVGRGLKQQH